MTMATGGFVQLIPAQTLPTALTAVVSVDCELDALTFCNTTAGSLTVTVQDGNGVNLCNALAVGAHATVQLNFRQPGDGNLPAYGQFMSGGVQWQASANPGIDAHIMARHE